ncbi:hypothetical protein QYF36_026931 [Acer negundo]|nr:hypothetical protein QYF36_026931 [Acer negundo]
MGTCCGQKGQGNSAFFFVVQLARSSDFFDCMDADVGLDRNVDIWRQSCLKTYASIDQELKQNTKMDSFRSGTTALTIVKQGKNLIAANVGDSRAVLATLSDDASLVPLQLTINFTPNLPEEAERIKQLKVWDAISNQEAVEILSSMLNREKSAKKLVECAVRAWKYKKRVIAMDDISAICLCFHSTSSPRPPPQLAIRHGRHCCSDHIKPPLCCSVALFKMALRGVWQLQKLVVSYCNWGGSSRGIRAFMESHLPEFKESNPQLEVVTELIRGQHPHLKAFYRNRNERVVCVKNMTPEDILLHATRLRNALGRKVIKLKTRHVTKHPSVQALCYHYDNSMDGAPFQRK